MRNDREEFGKVIQELINNGIRVARLSQEIDLCYGSLGGFKSHGYAPKNIKKLVRVLKQKAQLLRAYNPGKHSIDYICKETLLRRSEIARRIGISKQGLNQFGSTIPEHRVKQIQSTVQEVGNTLENLVSRLEKIQE